MKICENNEREVQVSEGLGRCESEKRKGGRERRGESKGEHRPGVPMMEVEEEIEKKWRVLKEIGTNRLVLEKGFGLQREMGKKSC